MPNDHAIIMTCTPSTPNSTSLTDTASRDKSSNGTELTMKVSGTTDISREPVFPDRVPLFISLPIWLKKDFCRIFALDCPLQGYISTT
jgi:hypothetical protein